MAMYWMGILTLLSSCQYVTTQAGPPIVETTHGTLQGYSASDYFNRSYDVFLGIPYAKPPVQDRRWQNPETMEPWDGTLMATEWGDFCIQSIGFVYPLMGLKGNESEDCLNLNIFIPRSLDHALTNNLPVVVYYYGGGFQVGAAESYPGELLANIGDVIVATVNYRVSTFGFFSTGDEVAPGNYGLWDAKAGLQWIRDNIAGFGGDASRITVMGQSAGGGLVTQLMLSNQTRFMFNRTVAISGAAVVNHSNNRTALYMSDVFNCSTTDSQEIVDCLREIDGKELDRELKQASRRDGVLPELGLVFDNQAESTFIDQTTEESWEEGRGAHLDFITGSAFHDSSGFVLGTTFGLPGAINETNDYNKDNQELFNYLLVMYGRFENTLEIIDTLYNRFPEMNSTDDEVASMACSRVVTDIQFGAPSFYQGEKHAQSGGAGSTYFYVYSHANSFQTGRPSWCNGSHIDDIYQVFGQVFMQKLRENRLGEYNDDDLTITDHIMKYYSNFAYSGDPNQGPHSVPTTWPQYDITTREYLLETATPGVDVHTQEIQDHYNWFLYEFDSVPQSAGITPFTPEHQVLQYEDWDYLQALDEDIDQHDYILGV